jgi:hypothetical protein
MVKVNANEKKQNTREARCKCDVTQKLLAVPPPVARLSMLCQQRHALAALFETGGSGL